MYHYLLCGLKVESDLRFPELTPWAGAAEQPFDIEFRLGPVARLIDPDASGSNFETRGANTLVFLIERVGRLLVEDGRRIIFDAFAGSDPERVRLNLIGTVQSILWHQRGLLPIHASTVMVGARGVAIAGASRSGKSVIAAALAARGCAIVADDFTIIDTVPTPPVVLPGYQKLRLFDDACVEFGLRDAAVGRAHPVHDKFVVAGDSSAPDVPVALTDVFIISGARGNAFSAERLEPTAAIRHLLGVIPHASKQRALSGVRSKSSPGSTGWSRRRGCGG